MSFFNKKEDVLDVVLTPHGRRLLSKGKLKPAFYSFLDDDILYDVGAASITESNYQTKDRILVNTPTLKPPSNLSDLDKKLRNRNRDLVSDVVNHNTYTIGTSNSIKEGTPSWDLTLIRNEISSSSTIQKIKNKMSGSTFAPDSDFVNLNIPQLDITIEYTMSIGNIHTEATPRGLTPSPDLQASRTFSDGTYLNVEPDQIIARILEKNGFLHSESLEIEAYKYDASDTERLIPLSFSSRKRAIVDDLLLDEDPTFSQSSDSTPLNVEYFFDVRVDKEIPLSDICEGIQELRSKEIFGDFEIECPDLRRNVPIDIYSSPITPEDIEDCDV